MGTVERIFFIAYVLVGPFAWLWAAYFVKVGRSRMSKLLRSREVLPATPPLVSILIPAKDESVRIRDCVNDVLKSTYPAFEVIAINDRSDDDTGAILDTFANDSDPFGTARERRGSAATTPPLTPPLRIVHIDALPPGWLGKCQALDQGATHARGDWLFFVDSDVRLQPDALTKMIATAVAREYDALSILTTIETHTFMERLMLPLLAGTWMAMFAGDQTNEDSEPDKALANGQVFLIRADAYRKVGGHAAVKDRIVEDVELMRTLKAAGFKTRLMAGAPLAATRMHTQWGQLFNGWARIFAGTARGSVWPMVRMIAVLVLCVLSVIPAIIFGCQTGETGTMYVMTTTICYPVTFWHNTFWSQGIYWLSAVGVHGLLMTIVFGFVWRWSGNSPWYALLLPISIPMEIAVLGYAVRKAISGKIDWRGAAVDVRQTSRVTSPPK